MSEGSAAKQAEKTTKVKKQSKPQPSLLKTFAAGKSGSNDFVNGRDSQGSEILFLQRRCACGNHLVAGGSCSACSSQSTSSHLIGSGKASVQRELDESRIHRPDPTLLIRPVRDFSQIPTQTRGPSPGLFQTTSPGGPALSSGKGQTAFIEEQAKQRQANQTAQSGQTAVEGDSVQTMLLQRSFAGKLTDTARAAHSGQTNYPSIGRDFTRDHSFTLRREGDEPAKAAPKLSKTTLRGPKASDYGGYSWQIQWHLSEVSPKGGYIVQKIEAIGDISAADSSIATGYEGHAPYWESWKVNKGQSVTDFAEKGDPDDDLYFNDGYGEGSRGQIGIVGSADFYEGLTLPASFKVIPSHPAGILLTAKSDPSLTGGSGALSHDITARWDSVEGDGTTELAST